MEYIVNSAEMKRAALGAAEELFGGAFDLKKVVVVCGSGNNGGDGVAIVKLKDIGITDLSFEGVYPITTTENLNHTGY